MREQANERCRWRREGHKTFFLLFLVKTKFLCAGSNEFEWWTKAKANKKVWGNSFAFSLFSSASRALFLHEIISIPLTALPFNYSQLRGYWFSAAFRRCPWHVHMSGLKQHDRLVFSQLWLFHVRFGFLLPLPSSWMRNNVNHTQ